MSNEQKRELTLGVTSFEDGIVVGYPSIALRFSYLTLAGQDPKTAEKSHWYALSLKQARNLIDTLQRRIDQLEHDPT